MQKKNERFKVIEKFVSINGEGRLSGQLAVFIRFAGCNLNCRYCDTSWANEQDANYELMTANEIYEYIKKTEIDNVTLTGGEPLIQDNINNLLEVLIADNFLKVEIETNGSIALKPFISLNKYNRGKIFFSMDYKLASSNMEKYMLVDNFMFLGEKDIVKFVVSDSNDLINANEIIKRYDLTKRTNVYISPAYGQIKLAEIVDFMKTRKLNKVNLQIQLHKVIWSPEIRSV